MKKFFGKLILLACVVFFIGIAPGNNSQAVAESNNKFDVQVIRTVENGVHYVTFVVDGIQIYKTVEL